MRTKQLMVWTAVVAVVWGCMGAGCSRESKQVGEDGAAAGISTNMKSGAARVPYVIPQAGIRLNPPPSWDAGLVQVRSVSGVDAATIQPGADFSVAFEYRAEQPAHHDEPLLNLHVIRKAAWAPIEDDSPGAVIDTIGDWVFVAVVPSENPYRAGLLDADQFEAMRVTISEVRELFSIEDGGPVDASLRAESKGK